MIQPQKYYGMTFVKFELIKQLRGRYMSFRKKSKTEGKQGFLVRYLAGWNLNVLGQSIECFGGWSVVEKMYHDLLLFNPADMPLISFDIIERKEQRSEFDKVCDQKAIGYDFAIDIDSQVWRESWEEAKAIKSVFDQYGIPYSLKWSGHKGFHFRIQDEYLPQVWSPVKKVQRAFICIDSLVSRHDLKHVDMSIYDTRRILKLAYSLDGEHIVLPLTDKEFEAFTPDYALAENILYNGSIKIMNRGLLERPGNSDNVKNMMGDYT